MNPKVVRLIRVEETRGVGVIDDPCRIVICYYDFDGTLVFVVDNSRPRLGEFRPA